LKAPHNFIRHECHCTAAAAAADSQEPNLKPFWKCKSFTLVKTKKHIHSCAAIADKQFFHERASPRTNLFYSSRRFEEPNEKNSREK
jgi:hypothetical protein